ncbi:lysophosphatidic acid receptor 2a isoform 2-T3 [Pholidichthys leucotaenia]
MYLNGEESKMGVITTEISYRNTCAHNYSVSAFYNYVNKSMSDEWNSTEILVLMVGLSVALTILLANLMVMIAIFMNQRFHFPIYYLLGNMAAADMFAGVAYANLMFHTGPWTRYLSKEQWYIRGALIDISLTASVANLLAVAVERHQTILTMRLHSNMSKRRVVLLILCIWATAIIMGVVPSVYWNCECDLDNCSTIAPLYSCHFLIFWAVLNLFTFIIMVAMYTRIYIYVKRQNQQMSPHTSDTGNSQTVVSLMKTISMVLESCVCTGVRSSILV